MTRVKRLAKEGSLIVVGQIMTVVGALVLVRVLTKHLDPAQYGQLSLGLTVASLVNAVVMGGLINGIIRFYSIAAEKQDLSGYLRASRRLMLYATLVVVMVISLLVIIGRSWLGYSQWTALAAAALVFSVFSAYNGALSGIQNAARQRAIVALHGSLDAWLKIGLVLVVMFWLGNSSETVVIGYAFSSLLVTSSQLFFLSRTILVHKQQPTKDHQWMGQIWAYSLPFATWGIFGWAQQSSARWALEAFTTTETVGLYSVLSQLGYAPIQMATGTVLTFLTPILFARSGDGSSVVRRDNVCELTNKLVVLGLGLTTVAALVAALLHSYIFHLLVNNTYSSVSYFLPWFVLAGGIFAVAQIYASRVMALLMPKKIIPAYIGSSTIGIASAIAGTFYFELAGAVVAMLAHAISYFLWIFITVKSIDKQAVQSC
jgi:O-antigen/teichoic acid export membrane protein